MRKRNKPQVNSLLDICILTAGGVDLFQRCVNTLLPMMKSEYRLQVHNNGAISPEYNQAYKLLPENAQIKQTNVNGGYPAGANSAIRMGSSPLVLFVSDDIFLHDGAIDVLLRRMDDPSIGICGLKLLFPEDDTDKNRPSGKVQHIGHAINLRGEVVHPLVGWSADNPKCGVSRDVVSITGACFITRRKLFQSAGGFNSIYGRGYFEDVDLCMTLKNMGHRIFIDADAVATHGVALTYAMRKDDPKPDLNRNFGILLQRWQGKFIWDEWRYL